MKIELDTRKSLNENAARYYEHSKKARAKAAGVRKAIADTERKLAELEQKIAKSKKTIFTRKTLSQIGF